MSAVWKPPESRIPLSHRADWYPTSSGMTVPSGDSATSCTLKVTEQKPGGTAELAGTSTVGVAVNTRTFGLVPPPGLFDVQAVGQSVVMFPGASPRYDTTAPSSVQGGVSGSRGLQSRSNANEESCTSVPPRTDPAPKRTSTSITSPTCETAGAPG